MLVLNKMGRKKKVLILAGGTATAWHLSNVITDEFKDNFVLCVADINKPQRVPASSLCDYFFQVPPISDQSYYVYMLSLLEKEKIDILIPLIDSDLLLFSMDNDDLEKLNVISTAPKKHVMNIFIDKLKACSFLQKHGVVVPKVYRSKKEIKNDEFYFQKPKMGFGSQGAIKVKGADCMFSNKTLVQEVLSSPEVTVEIFKSKNILKTVCRERIEIKSGVCTKARFFYDADLYEIIRAISSIVDLPIASCIQFMKNDDDDWCLIDCNLRLGAGTALSSKAGFKLTGAFLRELLGCSGQEKYLQEVPSDTIVLRVYNEILMSK